MGKALQIDTSGLLSMGAANGGWINNLGLKYGADSTTGRMKIVGVDATNLSSTNKAWVTMPSATTPGTLARIKVDYTTHEHYFEDDAAATSDIAGEEFGLTTGRAYAADAPFFIYAVNSNDTASGLAFAISMNPFAINSPATANSGYHGNPGATPSYLNFFYLTSTNVTVTHASKPALLIGCFRMQMSASDDWTVQTLSTTYDGIGQTALDNAFKARWSFAAGHRGAITSYHINNSAGSGNPTWATAASISYLYKLNREGSVSVYYDPSGAGNCTNGSNGNDIQLYLPYNSLVQQYIPCGRSRVNSNNGVALAILTADTNYATFEAYPTTGGIAANSFAAAGDDLSLVFTYLVKGS